MFRQLELLTDKNGFHSDFFKTTAMLFIKIVERLLQSIDVMIARKINSTTGIGSLFWQTL
jgi:hypothetical protein